GRIPSRRLALPRSERLRRSGEIQGLFQQGNRDERPSFVALWRPRVEGRRVGFAVSRRVGSAVARNRARRRMREAYRREEEALSGGVTAIFVARPSVLTRPFNNLLEEMRLTLKVLERGAGRPRTVRPDSHL